VKQNERNFIFKENTDSELIKDEKYIKVQEIETPYSLTESFIPTDIDTSSSSVAQGKVTLYNLFDKEVNLVPDTRLQTEDGIVFQISQWINIPAASTDNF